MSEIIRIAFFKPAEELKAATASLTSKHEYSLRIVNDIQSVTDLIEEETQRFDTLVVPQLLANGSNATATCIQIKADPELSSTPILALTPSSEKVIMQSLYGSGADLVLSLPLDSDIFHMHLSALTRNFRHYRELLDSQIHETGLVHPVIRAFHGMREGFLLFSTSFKLLFANKSAERMLGITDDGNQDLYQRAASQFVNLIKEHDSSLKLSNSDNNLYNITTIDINLLRLDNQSFRTTLAISSIARDEQNLLGYSVSIKNLGEIQHLGNTLLQAQKTRILSLTMTGVVCGFLQKRNPNLLSPLQELDRYSSELPRSSSLSQTITFLLEILDQVINPDISVRIKSEENLQVAINGPDLITILGAIMLHAAEQMGPRGELLIESISKAGMGIVFTVSAETSTPAFYTISDDISRMILNDFTDIGSTGQATTSGICLQTAQVLAQQYRTTIEYQETEERVIKMRICLPASSKA